jgi:hypothetical protein
MPPSDEGSVRDYFFGAKVAEPSALNWIKRYSDLMLHLQPVEVSPWFRGWKDEWEKEFNARYENKFRSKDAKAVLNTWRDSILELTGRHPSLAGPAIDALDSLLSPKAPKTQPKMHLDLVDSVAGDQNRRAHIRRFLEDYLAKRALRRVRGGIRDLANSHERRTAYETLKAVAATGAEGMNAPADYRVREALGFSGLVFEDVDDGRFRVPGYLLRRELLGARPHAFLEADPGESESGVLHVTGLGAPRTVVLSGIPYRILRFLYDERGDGEYLEREQIMVGTKLQNDDGFRNAMHRLRASLKESGLERLVENRYGKGYRWNDEGLSPQAPASIPTVD